MKNQVEKKPLNFFDVLISTLAAVVGVQSKAMRDRDFSRGNIFQFIIAGILFTVVFVLVIIYVVKFVLG